MLLLTVQIQAYLAQVKMLKIERIALQMSVEGPVGGKSDDYASGQLTGKQFLVTDVQVILRNGERDLHTTRRTGYFAVPRSRVLA